MQRSLGEKRMHSSANGHAPGPVKLELDAVVVGGGFAGCYLLYLLRKEGFNTKIVEAGTGLGGIWHWNSYPGARVDSHYPIYALSIPEVYNTWTWKEKFPGSAELREYFKHVDRVLDLSKDVFYETRVINAKFDADVNKWHIKCNNGTEITARFFLCSLGFAAKRHFPDWDGLDSFQGAICHSSFWPEDGIEMKGKRVGLVGTGATGVQIAQEVAKEAKTLTVFQRTPNLTCPMNQATIDPEQAKKDLSDLPALMDERLTHEAGFLFSSQPIKAFDHTAEEREVFFEDLWNQGGFRLLANSYGDLMTDERANREVYEFWKRKVRARITDPEKKELLAPTEPPHAFGGKRPSLEQDFYEQMDKPQVKIINIRQNPVSQVVPKGIVTSDGQVHEFDVIALATGFDSFTGSLKEIDIEGLNGVTVKEKWKLGTWTYLGMTISGIPNLFFTYGPQAPTAYANGPSITEPQSEWIVKVMKQMREAGHTKIDATENAEKEWKETITTLHGYTLRDKIDGPYMGTNIPGKPREALNYAGGIPRYLDTIERVFNYALDGFEVQ